MVLADIHKATELKSQAIQFLLVHKEEVFAQGDWKHKLRNHPEILMEVLESTVDPGPGTSPCDLMKTTSPSQTSGGGECEEYMMSQELSNKL